MKRRRLSSDVDGNGEQSPGAKKKRRLRLLLITSRLSPPFSIPATYIVSRGTSKIAVWARQRALGRWFLRKAAILNRVQRDSHHPGRRELVMLQQQPQPCFRRFLSNTTVILPSPNAVAPHIIFPAGSARAALVRDENPNRLVSSHDSEPHDFDTSPRHSPVATHDAGAGPSPGTPRRQYIPLPPSPLNLTNYDYSVFDNEDGSYFERSGNNGDGDDHELIYSDFNNILLEPSEPVLDDHDSLAAFDSLLFWNRWN